MKIAQYKTAIGPNAPELDAKVNELINQGFQPYGSPHFETWDIPGQADTHGFFQAMVKHEGAGDRQSIPTPVYKK
jgi:hypothetical protein